MHKIISFVILLPVVCILGQAQAELAIIAHKSNANANMDPSDLARIFLGKSGNFPSGDTAVPIDQVDSSPVYSEFYQKVANKTPSQLKAYWSRLIFTGKGQPPRALSSAAEIKELIASNPNLVGYINSNEIDDSIKVLLTIP